MASNPLPMDDTQALWDEDALQTLRSLGTLVALALPLGLAAQWVTAWPLPAAARVSGMLPGLWAMGALLLARSAHDRGRLRLARTALLSGGLLLAPLQVAMHGPSSGAWFLTLVPLLLTSLLAPQRQATLALGHAGLLLGALVLHTGTSLGAALGQLWVPLLGSGLLVLALRLHTDLVRASLQWALHAQAQDAARTTILRAREAALTTALRDRDQAQHRLERLNRDLIQAREAADEANRLKTRFLATMSHELRTPLNAIIGFSEILPRYGPLVERQQQLLGRINQNGEHLLGLINDILDLAKVEAGRMELQRRPTELGPLLRGVAATASGLIQDTPLEFILDAPDDLPVLDLDPTRIRQVLLNLLSNAIKFTPQGSVTLQVLVEPTAVHLVVRDTGIGIPPTEQARVFEEFQQVQGDLHREYAGTGLGLPIARQFVALHGGTLTLASTVGVGSTFTCTLPRRAPAPAASPAAPTPAHDPQRAMVVVIDDDPHARALLERYLEDAGYGVVLVGDSRTAVAVVRQVQPALVILDIQMPHLSGWAVVEQLKAEPETATIPVVVCSVIDDGRVGLALGAVAHLTKPVAAKTVLTVVSRWVQPPGTVLVVDDDPDARSLLGTVLREAGYGVVVAVDGPAALAQLAAPAVPLDLIILDLMLPHVDGFQVLTTLRAQPAHATVPVLVVSAKDLTPAEQALLATHASAVLQKTNLTPAALLTVVGHLTGGPPDDRAEPPGRARVPGAGQSDGH